MVFGDVAEAVGPTEAGEDFWVVVAGSEALVSEDTRQVWQPRGAVDLEEHQLDVGRLARMVGESVNAAPEVVEALEWAGLLHDEGKRDPRFQRALRWRRNDYPGRVLAKSSLRSQRAITQALSASGLARGWRHEQLSAAIAHDKLSQETPAEAADLVVRLVGTTHGRGRHEYPHTGSQLESGDLGLSGRVALFDDGEWENLLERTHRRWGLWGCAFLEALLRAADANVSRRQSWQSQ
jgi:CRISPR-associated endonuclease/helicase Cas3